MNITDDSGSKNLRNRYHWSGGRLEFLEPNQLDPTRMSYIAH